MNERIRNMAEQCGIYWSEEFGITKPPSAHDLEAFAKLVATHCRDLADSVNTHGDCAPAVEEIEREYGLDA